MPRQVSAGVLAWRRRGAAVEFLLVHPGGPFWANKDAAAWSIPKGVAEPGEDGWAAARREFEEELGQPVAALGEPWPLSPCQTGGGKLVLAWLVRAEVDAASVRSNSFEMEWPPRSERRESFPEVDRAAWFDAATAMTKIHQGQQPILREAAERLGINLLSES